MRLKTSLPNTYIRLLNRIPFNFELKLTSSSTFINEFRIKNENITWTFITYHIFIQYKY